LCRSLTEEAAFFELHNQQQQQPLTEDVATTADADSSSTATAASTTTADDDDTSTAAAAAAVDAQAVSNSSAVSSDTTVTTASAAATESTTSAHAASGTAVSADNSAVASHQADVASDVADDAPTDAPTAAMTTTDTDTTVAGTMTEANAQPATEVVDGADISSSGDSSTDDATTPAAVRASADSTDTSGAETGVKGDSGNVAAVTAVTDSADITQQRSAVEDAAAGSTSLIIDAAAAATDTTAITATASSDSSGVTAAAAAAAQVADILTDTDAASSITTASVMLHEGAAVEARYKGRERYFPGLIRRVNHDGTYDIDYSDGERELGVLAEYIRTVAAAVGTTSNSGTAIVALQEGAAVEARYRGRECYFAGTIARANSDGTYDVNYDDGERELSVAAEYVRAIAAAVVPAVAAAPAVDTAANMEASIAAVLLEGTAVEARYKGGERYFPGLIRRVNRDGTYDIDYSDGERELSVAAEYIRPVAIVAVAAAAISTSTDIATVVLSEGTAVEARYKGRERYFPGLVRRVNRDGTYDIDYSDGERELGVAAECVRAVVVVAADTTSNDIPTVALQEGVAIEARYKGRERYYAGTITHANSDGTYDINYSDGERELSVAAEYVRAVAAAPTDTASGEIPIVALQEGAAIEARYRGRERYFPGLVRRVNRDGTYDIDYSDGERELGVLAQCVRPIALVAALAADTAVAAAAATTVVDTSSNEMPRLALSEGAAVEARYKGRERYFPGTVAHVSSDGTYDINYSDGERELNVLAEYIRPIVAAAAPADTTAKSDVATLVLLEGAAVEARYNGRERYCAATVACANSDGTYNINYNDGECELSVAAEYIRTVVAAVDTTSNSETPTVALQEGAAVEARYKGRERYYAGTITHANSDGTYDINYSDGERELSVAAEYVRPVAAPAVAVLTTVNSDTAVVTVMQEGAVIEARYRGRERYFPGTVAHVNSDGTYDINYSDGERELSVAAEYIRTAAVAVAVAADTASNNDTATVALQEGVAVEARYRGRERYFPGLVRRVNRDGTYDIDYSDGERELGVLAECVRPIALVAAPAADTAVVAAAAAAAAVDTSSNEVSRSALSEGAAVEARYKGRERYFPGTVAHVNSDGTYDINYDDGTPELGVSPELVRAVGSTAATAADAVTSDNSATDSVSEQQQQQAVASENHPDTAATAAATADDSASDTAAAAVATAAASDQHSAATTVIAGAETAVKAVDEDDYFAVISSNDQPLDQPLDTVPLQVHKTQLPSI
jgi:hypothetical protein